jgi:hypothetical protein
LGRLPRYPHGLSWEKEYTEGSNNSNLTMNNNVLVAVLVVVVIGLVGWFAYNQGYLGGSKDNEQDIQINLPGSSSQPQGY